MDKWQTIFNTLATAGIDVYAPGAHVGICTSPYCVVQAGGGSIPSGKCRVGSCEYRIYLVVPAEAPAQLEMLAQRVRDALSEMVSSGTLRLETPRSAMVPDDGFSALISYIDYTCCYSERN